MDGIGSFIWFTLVIVGILLSSLAMISMGAACWDYCEVVPAIAQYLVIAGSIFFCILILLLLLTFCICTSSGEPKVNGSMKITLCISVTIMYILVVAGSTVLFVHSSEEDNKCLRNLTKTDDFNSTAPRTADFCSTTLLVFTHSVLMLLHFLLFFSILVTFYTGNR
ncbi:uncharacterized protein LOC129218704 [Uloborus diversus]|uniref:uncharacterized protein LOC129218704 n=1 Tax=Uloborus diversus TaxID=327109 RepID=UPI002409096E|nr:uncharacterized protein LOC129218704 [Uloborus diversus]XP_054709001.1 uncharacterized protein LOC129218704 [Uloborus diversus]